MADFEAKLGVSVDTSSAINSIKALQSKIAELQKQIANNSSINASAAQNFQRNLIADINASGKYVARMQQIRSTTEQFTYALEKNKLSMGQYFRYAASTTKTFGSRFSTEFKTIEKVARERVKALQTQYIAMGRDANGALQSIAVRPLKLDLDDLATKQAIVAQKQQIFNQLLKQGSTNLLNFGKNTQWAGRQLMVGFTIPLSIFGSQASKAFMTVEEQAIKFKRVYGELFTPPGEADQMLESLKQLGSEFTKYGVSLEETLSLAGDVAAMGKTGADMLAQVEQATKLSVLGGVDQAKALEASISITNAFGIAAEDLATKIDFLNAVENQTVLSIDDLTTAIPKAGPVVRQLGGSVEDLAFFMTAMKEGGINASEGANALKSGLASMINPTTKASDMLKGFGINIKEIVESNKGDLKQTLIEFASALDELDPLNRARAIEELFGKFQFARISTLFQNITQGGTQASRVLELTASSAKELADLSNKELGNVSESTTYKFKKVIEDFQIAIAPIGEQFLKAVTPIIEFATGIIKRFDSMSDGAKNFVVILTAVLGAVAPVALMTFGLVANGIANLIKGFAAVRNIFSKTSQDSSILGSQLEYMTQEQLQAGAVAASLEQSHQRLAQQFTVEREALELLIGAYRRAAIAGEGLVNINPIPSAMTRAKGYASGGIVSGPGTGKSDSIIAMLSNGEAVIPASVVREHPELIEQLVSGNIPGYSKGTTRVSAYGGSSTMLSGGGVPFAIGNSASSKLGMSRDFFQSSDFEQMFSASAAGLSFRSDNPGKRMNADALQPYLDEAEGDLRDIVGILRTSEESLRRAGTNIDSFDEITANAKRELEVKFAEMTARGGRSASVAKTVQREMLDPTAESLASSKLSEVRSRAVKLNTETGETKETVFRMTGNVGQTTANKAAQILYPETSARLAAQGGSYAHLNEKRLGGPSLPIRGGIMGLPDSPEKQAAISRLNAASEKQRQSYPEGVLLNRSDVQKDAKETSRVYKEELAKGLEDPYVESRDRNSPHRLAEQDGADDQAAYDKGRSSASKRGSRRAQGQMVDGEAVITNPNARTEKRARRASAPAQTESRDSALAAKAAQDELDAAEAKALADQQAADKSRRMSAALNGAMYGLTTLAGMAAMTGGEVGKVGSFLFQLTAGMTALMTVTEALTGQNVIAMIQGRVKMAQDAIDTATKAGAIVATNVFTASMARAAISVNAFLGPVGWATLAIGGLVAAVMFVMGEQEKSRKKIEALGVAAEGARGPLAEIAKGFTGKDFQAPQVGTGQQGGASSAVQARQAELLNTDGALDQYQEYIDKVTNVADSDMQGVVDQMALTFASYGMEAIDIEALIRALLEKAGKTDLKLDFKSVSVDTAASKVKSTAQDLANDISKAYDQVPRKEAVEVSGNMVMRGRGEGSTDEQAASKAVADNLAKVKELTSGVAVGLLAVNAELENNAITADVARIKADSFISVFEDMDPTLVSEMLPDLATSLGLDNPELYTGIEDVQMGLQLIKAQALGMPVDKFAKILASDAGSGEEVRQKAMAQKSFNAEFNKYLKNKETEQKIKEQEDKKTALTADFEKIDEEITALENKNDAYDALIARGETAAFAAEMVADATWLEAYAHAADVDAINGNTDAMDSLIEKRKTLLSLSSYIPTGGSGTPKTTPYQDAIEQLKQQQSDIKNTTIAYQRLRQAGMDIATSSSIASDSTVALALATTKVGTEKYTKLLALIKEIDAASKKNALKDLVAGRKSEFDLKSKFMSVVPIINKLGIDIEDALSILDDPTTAAAFIEDIKDGKIDSQDMLNNLKLMGKIKKIDIQLNLLTPEQQWSAVDGAFSDIDAAFDAIYAGIDKKFAETIDAQQEKIDKAQKQVDDYQAKIDENDYQLSGIQNQEDKINETYDKRIKSLDKVLQINKLIQTQEKSNMQIADALSQGDIAAAARAVQEARVQEAAARAEDLKSRMEMAKEKELASVTAEDGRTRKQIEADTLDYKNKILKIQHDTIDPAEKARDAAIAERDAEKDAATYLDQNKTYWDGVRINANLAKIEAEGYKKAIEDALKLLPGLTGGKVTTPFGGNETVNPNQAEIDELNRLRAISREKYQNSDDAAYKQRLYDLNVERGNKIKELGGVPLSSGGLVPKYFAAGGFARGTDTIPAMLTPGEFVMRRPAVNNFGVDRLKAINSGAYHGDSVYNYNLSVNVKSDANAEQIANTVMARIRQVESKSLRGGRF